MKKRADPPQQQTVTNSAIVPQKVHPYWTKPLPSVQANVIADDDGKKPTNFHHKVYMSLSGPSIITPEVLVLTPRVQAMQPPRVDKGGPSSNLKSKGKKNTMPLYALTA